MEEKNLENVMKKIVQEMSSYDEAIKKLVTKEEFKRLEQCTEKIEQRTEKIEQRTDRLEKATEKIAIIVGDHTEKIKNLVTREEFDKKMDRVLQGEDKILAILTHLERERIFTFDRIERMEEEINKIKKHLALA